MNRIKRDTPTPATTAVPACAHRHAYHMMPPQGWMNDPNGFIFYQGQYHLFYQHYPYAPQWGLMHWGHCVSDDLIRWKPLPLALKPDHPYDENGCFSGSSLVHGGKLYVFYTGNAADGRQTQCLAVSADGVHFEKYENNPVIPSPPDFIKPNQFRDPCVFCRNNRYYMVAGAEGKDHHGQALVYVSDNLLDWAYLASITTGQSPMGYMWECPNMIFVDDQAVLMLSPQGMTDHPQFDNSGDTGFFVGHFDADTGAYTHGEFHKLDYGFDLYATQTTKDTSGRCLVTAWMSTWATPTPTKACQWAGSMILPREMRFQNGKLTFHPVRELTRYLSPVTTVTDIACGRLHPLRGSVCRLELLAQNADFAIRLFCSPDGTEYTALSYSAQQRTLSLDLSRSGEDARGTRSVALSDATEPVRLDLYLDRSSLEVFIGEGEQVMSARVFPHQASDGIQFFGDAMLTRLSLWKINIPEESAAFLLSGHSQSNCNAVTPV